MSHDLWFTISNVGFTIDFVGKLLISYTAIKVHHRVWQEHKIDEKVFTEMGKERNLGILGIALMLIGFTMEMLARMYLRSII